MSDFFQNGIITTLHNLSDRPIDSLESELSGFAEQRPMALVLPCLYSELATPALANIVAELAQGALPGRDHHWPRSGHRRPSTTTPSNTSPCCRNATT